MNFTRQGTLPLRMWQVVLALLFVAGTVVPSPAQADTGEARLYLDLDGNVLPDARAPLTLRPMLRTEQRFRRGGLRLLKISAGLRMDVRPWLLLQSYYAHIDKVSTNARDLHMAVFDVVLHHSFAWLGTLFRVGNEWHITDEFYRLRALVVLHFDLGVPWLQPWVSDEIRFDSDQTRINMQESIVGLDFRISSTLKTKLFYDLELTHRSRPGWQRSHVVGLVLAVRM